MIEAVRNQVLPLNDSFAPPCGTGPVRHAPPGQQHAV